MIGSSFVHGIIDHSIHNDMCNDHACIEISPITTQLVAPLRRALGTREPAALCAALELLQSLLRSHDLAGRAAMRMCVLNARRGVDAEAHMHVRLHIRVRTWERGG